MESERDKNFAQLKKKQRSFLPSRKFMSGAPTTGRKQNVPSAIWQIAKFFQFSFFRVLSSRNSIVCLNLCIKYDRAMSESKQTQRVAQDYDDDDEKKTHNERKNEILRNIFHTMNFYCITNCRSLQQNIEKRGEKTGITFELN